MNRKSLTLLSILILMTLGSAATILFSKKNTYLAQTSHLNLFIESLHYRQYNADGSLHLSLNTPHLNHFKKNNSSQITEPKIVLLDAKAIPWDISADHAKAWHGQDIIFLQGHVKFHHPEATNNPATTILTRTAYLYPKRNYATSKQHVIMLRPGSTLQGDGLHANLKDGVTTLLKKTHGFYHSK